MQLLSPQAETSACFPVDTSPICLNIRSAPHPWAALCHPPNGDVIGRGRPRPIQSLLAPPLPVTAGVGSLAIARPQQIGADSIALRQRSPRWRSVGAGGNPSTARHSQGAARWGLDSCSAVRRRSQLDTEWPSALAAAGRSTATVRPRHGHWSVRVPGGM